VGRSDTLSGHFVGMLSCIADQDPCAILMPQKKASHMKKLSVFIGAIFLVAAAFMAFKALQPSPGGQNIDFAHVAEAKHFAVKFTPENPDFQHNSMHTWIAEVKTASGAPVPNATITISGGMPAHGHGLPTSPQVTEILGDGRYKVDGMRFNMAGQWQLNLAITADDVTDTVTFDLVF
jgi:hypothetical protein